MRIRFFTSFVTNAAVLIMAASASRAVAQTVVGTDPVTRLSMVLPADVARHVIAVINTARSENLPSDALANRSLKFVARGIPPQDIARAADEQLARMRAARDVLRTTRSTPPNGDEIEAGAEALRQGVTGPDVARLAQSAPSGRSLTVPLYVMGSLVSQGFKSGEALERVQSKLIAHASDADIEASGRDNASSTHVPANEGRGRGAGAGVGSGRSGSEGATGAATHGPPPDVPANAGSHGRPPTIGTGHTTPKPKGRP
jgi:hypothetical protein